MVQDTINLIVSRMTTMTDQERERVMCALLDRFCVACGKHGNWSQAPCDCEPKQQREAAPEPRQLWLIYAA
jgi:hypothetical protein